MCMCVMYVKVKLNRSRSLKSQDKATPTLRNLVMLPTEYTCISSMAPELALLTTGERWQLKKREEGSGGHTKFKVQS